MYAGFSDPVAMKMRTNKNNRTQWCMA